MDKITGVAGIEYRYDKGQIREEIYYNVNNELTLQKDIGCAIQECRYNEKGKVESQYFYGTDKNAIVSTKYGCAGIKFKYDGNGNKTDTNIL